MARASGISASAVRRIWKAHGLQPHRYRQFKLSNDALGVEYYSDLGPFPNFVSLNEQQHNIYAVVDFKVGRFDVNAGVGYGLTPGSDRLMAKMIIGTDLTPGVTNRATQAARSLRKPDSFLPGLPRP
jgi:hypothetical protein